METFARWRTFVDIVVNTVCTVGRIPTLSCSLPHSPQKWARVLRTALVTLPRAPPSVHDFLTTHLHRTTRSISVRPKVTTNLWSPRQLSSTDARRCRMFESCY